MNYNDTSAANELKKIIVALGGADSIYDIPGQKSDDVIRDLAKAVENAIANGTIGGGGGPTAEFSDPEVLKNEAEIDILVVPENDSSEEFLKKIVDNSERMLIDNSGLVFVQAVNANTFALKINGRYYLFPLSSVTVFDQRPEYGNYTLLGFLMDTTETFRLYIGQMNIRSGDIGQIIHVFTVVNQTAKKDYSASVSAVRSPVLLRVSGTWHYKLVGTNVPIINPPEVTDYMVILFEPLKHRDFGELSLLAVIYVDGLEPRVVVKSTMQDGPGPLQIPGLNFANISNELRRELSIAFAHCKDTILLHLDLLDEGMLTYTLSL